MWGRAGRPRLPGMKPWLLAAFVALNVSTASAACQPGPAVLDQAAGRLDEALQTLAHRTGCPVTVDPELLRGRQAPAVQGVFTPPQALVATLRGSVPEMLQFAGSGRPVFTPSSEQVRRPLNHDGERLAAAFAPHLSELRALLGEAAEA